MRVIVIGAGAAGLVASAEAARRGGEVVLLEKNTKTGVKILMSGGTRCNLTHDTDAKGITSAFAAGGRFLQPSVGAFPPAAVVDMFHDLGLSTKTESTGKIFPSSDRALHVRDALHQQAIAAGVEIQLSSATTGLQREGNRWRVNTAAGELTADRVIITAGGKSYPGCGTTGDAYAWLAQLGHTIVPPRPALVPLVGGMPWTHDLSGVTLEDCHVTVKTRPGQPGASKTAAKKPLARRQGSWLFTHFGFSGPAAMDVSGAITAANDPADLQVTVDLLPALGDDMIRQEFTNRSGDRGRLTVKTLLSQWLPRRLAEAITINAAADVALAELSRRSSNDLVLALKDWDVPITGTRGFEKAEVTAGGVSLAEVDPRTMASRKAKGLYVAGEVLDLDGPIGGYNFQAAFSTGRAAGIAVVE